MLYCASPTSPLAILSLPPIFILKPPRLWAAPPAVPSLFLALRSVQTARQRSRRKTPSLPPLSSPPQWLSHLPAVCEIIRNNLRPADRRLAAALPPRHQTATATSFSARHPLPQRQQRHRQSDASSRPQSRLMVVLFSLNNFRSLEFAGCDTVMSPRKCGNRKHPQPATPCSSRFCL